MKKNTTVKLLYRKETNGGVVFAEEYRAKYVAAIYDAMEKATTWGQFRSLLPDSEAQEIDDSWDEETGPKPDSEPFSPDDLPGLSEGDYPPWLTPEMDDLLPRDVLECYGTRTDTFLNGSFWLLPWERLNEVVAALRTRGF